MLIRALDPGVAQALVPFAIRAYCDAGNDATTGLDDRSSQDRMILTITASAAARRGWWTPRSIPGGSGT